MQEIRFIAYHKTKERLFNVLCIDFSAEEVTILDFCALDEFEAYTVELEKVVLLQYTGIWDKGRHEIYDGDIVEYRGQKYVVEFTPYGAIIGNLYVAKVREHITVVGNKYIDKGVKTYE